MYQSLKELRDEAIRRGVAISRIVLEAECAVSGADEAAVMARLEEQYAVMERAAHKALETPLMTAGGLITGITATQQRYAAGGRTLCGGFLNRVMALALSCSEVNASMGKICAAPTAGACGILPAVLIGVRELWGLDRAAALRGLLTASGVGSVYMRNATVAGAEGGCQAECGVAAAMAAAAAVEMVGGGPDKAIHAASFAMMNVMGLVCDPVAGLVQIPCAQRNASQAVNALLSADLALGGMTSIIDPDEVVDAMYRVGRMLPMQLRETALGGIAATPSGHAVVRAIYGEETGR